MATRDRFGGFGEPVATSQLQRFILNACDPSNYEPNLALNLEISDLINSKKGNTPREASTSIVQYVNHRNANVSLLALELLDICVKNCGYPFHLQISTKDFLNELVRRFPERPPVHPSRVQARILGLIEEWRTTICETSRYKEDLGFIRDMHRLLRYKGYAFPEVRKEDAAVLNTSNNLRSAEEMEEEEREAHSAKLQELIRRGGPQDLQEANRLMKIMAGYDTKNKTDWRAKAAEEVVKVQQKAKLLEEMLQKHQAGENMESSDVYEELANALMSAHPKIQKMCEEESDDHEAVAKLLEINDSIHRTIERYKLIKQGDIEAASKIPRGTLGTSGAGVSTGPNNELSLIDFGGSEDAATSSTNFKVQSSGKALEDDLLGLSLGNSGPISLGTNGHNDFTTFQQQQQQQQQPKSQQQGGTQAQLSNAQITSLFSGSNNASNQLPPPSYSTSSSPSANLYQFAKASSPLPPQLQQQQQNVKSPPVDPFSSLQSSQPLRQQSPFNPPQPVNTLSAKPPQSQASNTLVSSANEKDDDWEFQFSSSLPDTIITLIDTSLKISWHLSRHGSDILMNSTTTNKSNLVITDLTFQVAVPKAYSIEMQPQSSTSISATNGGIGTQQITQKILLKGVLHGQAQNVRIRWKVSFKSNNLPKEETGIIEGLPGSL